MICSKLPEQTFFHTLKPRIFTIDYKKGVRNCIYFSTVCGKKTVMCY